MLRDSQRDGKSKSEHEKIKDRKAQLAEFQVAIGDGWELHTDPVKIAARYQDRDLADAVPRTIIYWDIGILMGHISQLEKAVRGKK